MSEMPGPKIPSGPEIFSPYPALTGWYSFVSERDREDGGTDLCYGHVDEHGRESWVVQAMNADGTPTGVWRQDFIDNGEVRIGDGEIQTSETEACMIVASPMGAMYAFADGSQLLDANGVLYRKSADGHQEFFNPAELGAVVDELLNQSGNTDPQAPA